MKIRSHYPTQYNPAARRGLSLVEGLFALVVVGFLVGGAWHWAMTAYGDFKISSTVQMVHDVVVAIRNFQIDAKDISREDLGDMNISLPPDIQEINNIENRKGHKGIYNIWHGNVWAYPGNAAFWGLNETRSEVTLVLESVPVSICPLLIKSVMETPDIKPMMLFFAPGIGDGESLCLGLDSFCKKEAKINESIIKKACNKGDKGDKVLVGLTYFR